jgi:hypothetical protein
VAAGHGKRPQNGRRSRGPTAGVSIAGLTASSLPSYVDLAGFAASTYNPPEKLEPGYLEIRILYHGKAKGDRSLFGIHLRLRTSSAESGLFHLSAPRRSWQFSRPDAIIATMWPNLNKVVLPGINAVFGD